MAVSKTLRYQVLRRDNFTCRYCGAKAPDAALTVDHVLAVALGGPDTADNLVAACEDCNLGKSATPVDAPLIADVASDALRWARAIQEATARALADRDRLLNIEQRVWAAFDGLHDYLPGDWFATVHRFVAAGLAAEELVDAAFIARAATHVRLPSMWRYFCGICNNRVADRHAAARALLDAG